MDILEKKFYSKLGKNTKISAVTAFGDSPVLGGCGRMEMYETSIAKAESVYRFSRPSGRQDF